MQKIFVPAASFLFVLTTQLAQGQTVASNATAPHKAALAGQYGRIPLSFEANQGQTDSRVRFQARGQGYGLFLTGKGAVLSLSKPSPANQPSAEQALNKSLTQPRRMVTDVVSLELPGARPDAAPEGQDRLPGTANYFIGNDPARWHSNVSTFARVRYSQVYDGVDLVYYGNQRQLEYDFVVAPHADPAKIHLRFAGAQRLSLTSEGDLEVIARHGQITFHKPVLYQESGGRRVPVDGSFTLAANKTVQFHIGVYDAAQPLTIDPVLVYSTYLGGSGGACAAGSSCGGDSANAIAVDASGNVYVAGSTPSADFPLANDLQGKSHAISGYSTGFVSEINASGSAFVFSTYLGGSYSESLDAIAVDASGSVYVGGVSNSSDFPTVNAFQSKNKSGSTGVVAKITVGGASLIYSTYLGGSGYDQVMAIAADSSGRAYVTGFTESPDFPIKNALQSTYKNKVAGNGSAFVTQFSASGTSLGFSTYLGGSGGEYGSGIALDGASNIYLAGWTASYDLPTINALQSTNRTIALPGNSSVSWAGTGFVSKLVAGGASLAYSTYLGGSLADAAHVITVDAAGNAYVAGWTASSDFPTQNAVQAGNHTQSSANSGKDLLTLSGTGFAAEINPQGSALVYSTYLGGSTEDIINGIGVDHSGNAFVVGQTYSADFPSVLPIGSPNGGCNGTKAFLAEITTGGSSIGYSTCLGHSSTTSANAVAVDAESNAYVAGTTTASDFPVVNALQGSFPEQAGRSSGFVLKVSPALAPAPAPAFSPAAGTYTTIQNVSLSDTLTTASIYYTTDGSAPTIGSTPYTAPITVASTQTINAIATATGYSSSPVASAIYTINLPATAAPVFSLASGTYTTAQTVKITDATKGATIYYTTNGSTPTTNSTSYSGPISVSSNETIQAIAAASGDANSSLASATYTIAPLAAAPTFSPVAGTYTSIQSVALSTTTSGASIYYTLDGSTPTSTSTLYTTPLTVNASETIKAVAGGTGFTTSAVAAARYILNLPAATAPTFTVATGTYNTAQTVTLADTISGAVIRYTLDGSAPTTASAVYSGSIKVSTTETIKAIATAYNYSTSPVATAIYTLQAAKPAFSVATGTYTAIQSVTLSDATPGAKIYYTADGTVPTTASAVYSKPIAVNGSTTLEALATATGFANSSVAAAKYVLNLTAAAPVFSLAAGSYGAGQLLTITDTTPGATVYYTTNGSAPTVSSTVYSAPILVASTETVNAIAVATGYAKSAVTTAAYIIGGSPSVLSLPATGITSGEAQLNLFYNLEGLSGQVWFALGIQAASLPKSTPAVTASASTIQQSGSAVVTGLTAGKTYYYQARVQTAGGLSEGAVLSFVAH